MVEALARGIIAREIRREVVLHDDGSRPGMYDLRIGSAESPEVAIECVGAVDPVRAATWNAGPGRGSFLLQIRGDWVVELEPDTKVKQVRRALESLLTDCESLGVEEFLPIDWRLKYSDPSLYVRFKAIRIGSVHRIRAEGRGRVYLSMNGVGGGVDTKGRAVPTWISEFLHAPEREDVLSKLRKSGAVECHVFVPVMFAAVPWEVESYLSDPSQIVPEGAPDLPAPVTAVWILYGIKGLFWGGAGWRLFLDS